MILSENQMTLDIKTSGLVKIEKRRAVAPIIATLILVAIAVVGGIMIFVFAQDFFGGSEMSATPEVEVIGSSGYDARDIAGLAMHDGTTPALNIITGAGTAGSCTDPDHVVVHVRNQGSSPVTIASVSVNNQFAGQVAAANAAPAAGEFQVYGFVDAADNAAGIDTLGVIAGNTDASIIGTCGAAGNVVINGRSMPVEITTSNGASFTFTIVAGQRG